MQAFLPSSLLGNAPALPAANPTTPSARAAVPNLNHDFSRQLEQSRQRAQENARPAPQPAANKAAAPLPAAPAPSQPRPPEPARSETERAAARGQRKADAPAKSGSNSPEAADESTPARADDRDTETAAATPSDLHGLIAPPADPATPFPDATLAQPPATGAPLPEAWPAGLPRPAALPGAALTDTADGTESAGATATEGRSTLMPVTTRALAAQAAASEQHEASGTPGSTAASWQQAQAAAALADAVGAGRDGQASRGADGPALIEGTDRSLAPPGVAGPGSAALPAAKAGEVAQASLAAPVTSPEFRASLGAQVSILARAGVQQAELHLNPAELGPVSIQIVLDGQQAQVNFGADSALTRQIIEAGMPELAGALRDAGLTLTGGGVSQHAGGQRQDGNGNGAAGGNGSNVTSDTGSDGTNTALAEQTRRSVMRTAQGGVDVFA